MALNFGISYRSIFPETDETGEGIDPNKKQVILLDAKTYYKAVQSSELNNACNVLELQAAAAITPTALANMEVEIFSDSTGYLNKVDTANTTATFDTNKYTAETPGTEYIVIEADSLSAPWDANDCKTLEIGAGQWLVHCTTGTDAVRRAQIHKSLWYGTTGADPLILDFTNVTAVKTSHANDVGKRAHYAYARARYEDDSFPATVNLTGTFTNTTTNTDCSSWSDIHCWESGNSFPVAIGNWELPNGTVKNTLTSSYPGWHYSLEMGTDLSADEGDNPATCDLYVTSTAVNGGSYIADAIVYAIILCAGDITWVETKNSPGGSGTWFQDSSSVDYYTDHSIPEMTAAGSITAPFVIQSEAIEVPNGIKNFQVFAYKEATTGTGNITADVSLDNGAHYQTDVPLDTVIMNSLKSDYLILKLKLNVDENAGTVECSGFGFRYWGEDDG